ncbi:MAG TPA: hypothetical protein VGI39_04180 [Polyangiaceae bacterium]
MSAWEGSAFQKAQENRKTADALAEKAESVQEMGARLASIEGIAFEPGICTTTTELIPLVAELRDENARLRAALDEERTKIDGVTKLARDKDDQAAAAVANALEAQRRIRSLEIEIEDRDVQLEIARDLARGKQARIEELSSALAAFQAGSAPPPPPAPPLRRRALLWLRDRLADAAARSR